MPNIVLASQSPRRRELLSRIGLPHTSIRVDADEWYPASAQTGEEIVKYISNTKAFAAANMVAPEDIVIAADTIVYLDGVILGKPKDTADAARMLAALSGREHTVYTGVAVLRGGETRLAAEHTAVRFRTLTPAEITRYIATGEPMDKAGAYGIQGRGALFVAHLDGDYFNVMGLPLCRLGQLLNELGVELL